MEELCSYYFLKIQFKLNFTEEKKKQTVLLICLKRTQFDFVNAKQLVDLKPGRKKKKERKKGYFFFVHFIVFLTAR